MAVLQLGSHCYMSLRGLLATKKLFNVITFDVGAYCSCCSLLVVLLLPQEPLGKALARSGLWDEVYSDNYSVVFVRR